MILSGRVTPVTADYKAKGNASVCSICNTLDRLILDVGVSKTPAQCHASECALRGKFRLFVREIGHMSVDAAASNDAVHVSMSEEALSQVLVYAMIGRHFTAAKTKRDSLDWNVAELHYDVNTQTISVSRPMCVFEKSVYSILLVSSVVIVLTSMVLRRLQSYEETPTREITQISLDMTPNGHIKRRNFGTEYY